MKDVKDYKKEIIRDMKKLGTYKPEFEFAINTLADIKFQYNELNDRFLRNGMKINTKTSGGMKAAPIVGILSNLKKEIITYSDRLGLTPKAYESLKKAEEETKTGLELALEGFKATIGK